MVKRVQTKIYSLSPQMIKNADMPVYTLTDGCLYRTAFHPLGWSELPDYVLEKDGKIYCTDHHPAGCGRMAAYEFRGDRKLYRLTTHPQGKEDTPDFELRD